MELDTSGSSSDEDSGHPQDEVALASTWDFVPQWQPGAPAGSAEASPPPSAPVVEQAPAAPVSLDAPVEPVTTAKYGIGTAAPEAKAEAGWDQMFPSEEPASPEGTEAPKALDANPVLADEADPFTEFATEAARKRDEKPSAPASTEEDEGSGTP
jgi:hypothetical protein